MIRKFSLALGALLLLVTVAGAENLRIERDLSAQYREMAEDENRLVDRAGYDYFMKLAGGENPAEPSIENADRAAHPELCAYYDELVESIRAVRAFARSSNDAGYLRQADHAEAALRMVRYELSQGRDANRALVRKYLIDARYWLCSRLPTVRPAPLPPTAQITAVPGSIPEGTCTTLRWSTENATAARIEPDLGDVPLSGSRQVCPPADVTYRIVATGPGGGADDATNVNVLLRPVFLGDIYFEFDRDEVRADAQDTLAMVAEYLRRYPGKTLRVLGHTDAKGSDDYNSGLSQRRIDSAKRYLRERLGVEESRIEVEIPEGERQPIAPNEIGGEDNPAGRAVNRRVEFRAIER